MSRSIRLLAAASAVVVFQVVVPVPATAQLGGLARKVKKVAEETVEQQLPFTPQPAPEFSDRVLEITSERLGQLLTGFQAEAAHAKTAKKEYEEAVKNAEAAAATYERDRAAYDSAIEAYRTCADGFREAEVKASLENEAAVEKVLAEMNTEEFERYVEQLALRGEAFAKRTMAGTLDPATDPAWQQYTREVNALTKEQQRRMKAVMAGMDVERQRARTENPRLVAACGREPTAPARPLEGITGPESMMMRHGAEAAALEGTDPSPEARLARYTIMRERVINWMAEKGRPSKMGFSAEEVAVLQAAADRLAQAEKDLKKAGVSI